MADGTPPRFRVIWHGHWLRLHCGDGRYFGWRWWLDLGPLTILVRSVPA